MITPPNNCPSCSSELVYKKDILYCINPSCESTSIKGVEHFAKTLKIKGLGIITINKLGLRSISDIYELTLENIQTLLGSEKLAVKLFDEINISKLRTFNEVLPALGIPLVGKSATEKLSLVCQSVTEINATICKEAGLGEKTTANLLDWVADKPWELLPFDTSFSRELNKSTISEIKGVVCISGKLTSFATKAEAQKKLEELGYIVKTSITKDVTILVNESGKETQKTQKASESGIKIITNLKEFIGDIN